MLAITVPFALWTVTLEGFAPARPPAWMIVFSIVTQVSLIAFNLTMLVRTVTSRMADSLRVPDLPSAREGALA